MWRACRAGDPRSQSPIRQRSQVSRDHPRPQGAAKSRHPTGHLPDLRHAGGLQCAELRYEPDVSGPAGSAGRASSAAIGQRTPA
jgi:hypothetical protein